MGGYGSGRTPYSWRSTVEQFRHIDARELGRRGVLAPGTEALVTWSSGEQARLRSHPGRIELAFGHVRADGHLAQVRLYVQLSTTPCHFGGLRRWFCCPGCGRRVAVLYLGGARLHCRRCQDLAYASQRLGRTGRLERKASKIRRLLGGSGELYEPFPARPRGMHRRKYERLREAAENADRQALAHAVTALDRFESRHPVR